MRIGKINFTAAQQAALSFKDTKVTRAHLSSEFDQFVTLRLKTSKTDLNHTGVLIVIMESHQQTCLVIALCKLFFRDLKPADAPIFSQTKRAFSRQYMIYTLESCHTKCRTNARNYSDHSFQRSKAQHASDFGMLTESIQKLRHWTSNAF